MVAGAMLVTLTRSPPTASTSALRSVVVVTTASPSSAATPQVRATTSARAATQRIDAGARRAAQPAGSPGGNRLRLLPQALRHQTMHILLGRRDRTDAAIHRDAREPIGVEPGDLLLALEKLDHSHRGVVHRLVEVGILDMAHIIFRRLLGGPLHVFRIARSLGGQAVNAFLDIDDLRHPAIGLLEHHRLSLGGRNVALLADQLEGLRPGLIPGLVEIRIEAHADPRLRGLDAGEIERLALDHLDRDVELLVGGLDRGEVDLAIALAGVRVAGPQQRAGYEHRHVERRAGREVADVHVARILARRHAGILAGLLAGDAERAGEGLERDPDAGQEL